MDRQYFNIVKKADGLNQFFKTKRDPQSILPIKRLDTPVNKNIFIGPTEVIPFSDKEAEIPKHAFVKFQIVFQI